MNDLITLDDATRILSTLRTEFDAATTVGELDMVRRKSAALQQAMKLARLSLINQNQAAILRLNAMGAIGAILKEMIPHAGGRPPGETVPGADSSPPPTLDQLGFSRNYSSECQRIAGIRQEVRDEYFALGLMAREEIDLDPDRPQYQQPHEINKAGLFNYADWLWNKTQEERAREQAAAEAARVARLRADAVRDAAAAADANPDPIIAPETPAVSQARQRAEPPDPPPAAAKPASSATHDRVLAATRTAIGGATPGEREAAREALVRMGQERLDILADPPAEPGKEDPMAAYERARRTYDLMRDYFNRIGVLQARITELDDKITALARRERDHLAAIRNLKAENDRLRAAAEAAQATKLGLPTEAAKPPTH